VDGPTGGQVQVTKPVMPGGNTLFGAKRVSTNPFWGEKMSNRKKGGQLPPNEPKHSHIGSVCGMDLKGAHAPKTNTSTHPIKTFPK